MAYVNYFPNDGYCSCKRNPSKHCAKCQAKQDAQEDWGAFEAAMLAAEKAIDRELDK